MQLSPSKQNLFLGLSFSVLFIAIGEASAERIAKPLAQKQDSKFVKAERNPNQHRIVSTKANYKKPQTKPLSSYTLNLVKEFEGFSSQAYQDTDGTIVIGYGMPEIGGEKVKMGDYPSGTLRDRISSAQAERALKQELQKIQQEILSMVKVDLTSNQLSALVSFSFNIGTKFLADSTLLAKINAGDHYGAAKEFIRWNKADFNGILLPMAGLTRRRITEKQLFLAPSLRSR
jgi:GH24 family phage-related lysozyme (muramidase)